MTRWNSPCKSRRTREVIFQDFWNCQGVGANNPWEEAVQETYDAEVHRLVDEFRHQAATEGYYYSEN